MILLPRVLVLVHVVCCFVFYRFYTRYMFLFLVFEYVLVSLGGGVRQQCWHLTPLSTRVGGG